MIRKIITGLFLIAIILTPACANLKDDKENALSNLARAIELDVNFKDRAKKDEDFKDLGEDEDFQRIIR